MIKLITIALGMFCAITLASANWVLKFWVSCSQSLSRTFWTLAAEDAIIAEVFCCPARIAFSILELTPQNPIFIWDVRFEIDCWFASCCCQNELLLIKSTVLSWLLLLLACHINHAALFQPNPQNPPNQLLPQITNKNNNRIINQVHIQGAVDKVVWSIIQYIRYKIMV